MLGNAYYMLKEYSLALPAVSDCVLRSPNLRGGHVGLAIIYAQLGEIEKARAEAAEVLRIQPTYTNSGTTRELAAFKDPEDDNHFFDVAAQSGAARIDTHETLSVNFPRASNLG